jgi:hypothetical protein
MPICIRKFVESRRSLSIALSPRQRILILVAVIATLAVFQNCSSGFQGSSLSKQGSQSGPTPTAGLELWYYHHSYLTNAAAVTKSEALIDQAVAAGYTGLAFYDSYIGGYILGSPTNTTYAKQVVDYATSKGLKVLPPVTQYGWADWLLTQNPNLAEGFKVVGTQYTVVNSGGALQLQIKNSFPALTNGDFSNGTSGWGGDFATAEAGGRITLDSTMYHTAPPSAKYGSGTSVNARIIRSLTVTPYRQYHVQFWMMASSVDMTNPPVVRALDASTGADRLGSSIYILPSSAKCTAAIPPTVPSYCTCNWTQVDYTFYSMESSRINFYIGYWGANSGTLWIDDTSIEETGLVNLVRRPLAPLKIYSGSTTYNEGTDVNAISDPKLVISHGTFDFYHTPPTVTLPASTQLSAGQTVSLDYFATMPSDPNGKTSAALGEAEVATWLTKHAQILSQIFPAGSGYFMSHDEMRQIQACPLCSPAMTTAPLLSYNIQNSYKLLQAVSPGAPAYIWSDMIDPYHNAVANYYQVDGTLVGSWQGVPGNIIIMNWNLGKLAQSTTFFAGKDPAYQASGGNVFHNQIISGYYDSGNGATSAQKELTGITGVPGVLGFMYTTWKDDYTQLQQYADTVRAGWATYLKSIP